MKKKIVIFISIVAAVILLGIVILFATGKIFSIGRCVISNSGDCLLVDKTGPTILSTSPEKEIVPEATDDWNFVEFSHDNLYMSISIPEDWVYSVREYTEDDYNVGIDFWPKGKEGKLSLNYYPSGFGVCGTGLESEEIEIAGMKASKGTYDNKPIWDFISFWPEDIDVAVLNSADGWWSEYEEEAMSILQTIKIEQS